MLFQFSKWHSQCDREQWHQIQSVARPVEWLSRIYAATSRVEWMTTQSTDVCGQSRWINVLLLNFRVWLFRGQDGGSPFLMCHKKAGPHFSQLTGWNSLAHNWILNWHVLNEEGHLAVQEAPRWLGIDLYKVGALCTFGNLTAQSPPKILWSLSWRQISIAFICAWRTLFLALLFWISSAPHSLNSAWSDGRMWKHLLTCQIWPPFTTICCRTL